MRLARAFPALAAALLTCGCVAAAIPLAAGGLLVNSQRGGGEADGAVPVATTAAALPRPQSVSALPEPGTVTLGQQTGLAALPAPGADEEAEILSTTELPRPGASGLRQPAAPNAYADLLDYASRAASIDTLTDARDSALLVGPGTLTPEMKRCGDLTPAVLVDLDPGDALFAAPDTPQPVPALAEALERLREAGVTIYWGSAHGADMAGAIRRALVASGLDPDGGDPLLLNRYPNERKQTRRETVLENHCLVAIAGDERSDFDELYDYLRTPAGGMGLEPLIGNGWFLIPTPLAAPPTD